MAQGKELTLRLDKPIEQLIPAMIAFNNTELLAAVQERLVEYKGKTYDESSITEAKADRAALNKFSDALNAERIRIKKVYVEPLDKFTAQVNEVIAAVDDVSSEIDKQVKGYENARRAAKLEECKTYFASVISEELKDFVPYNKIHKDEWLNASKTMTAVKKDIDAIIEKVASELATIEALGGDVIDLKAIYFERLSLTDAIQSHKRREAEKARLAEAARLEAERKAAREAAAKEAEIKAQNEAKTAEVKQPEEVAEKVENVVPEKPELFTVAFKITGTAEQLNALKAYLVANKLKIENV